MGEPRKQDINLQVLRTVLPPYLCNLLYVCTVLCCLCVATVINKKKVPKISNNNATKKEVVGRKTLGRFASSKSILTCISFIITTVMIVMKLYVVSPGVRPSNVLYVNHLSLESLLFLHPSPNSKSKSKPGSNYPQLAWPRTGVVFLYSSYILRLHYLLLNLSFAATCSRRPIHTT